MREILVDCGCKSVQSASIPEARYKAGDREKGQYKNRISMYEPSLYSDNWDSKNESPEEGKSQMETYEGQ